MLSTAPHHIDALTGAASRAALESLLPAAIERAASASRPLALLVIDLDHFKSVNDAFGHARGDAALAEFTRRALGVIRAEDTLFRYGGDEFVALLPGASLAQAWRIAQRLLDEVQGAPFPGDPPLALTLSVGVATFPEDGATPTALFAAADRRSYWAKRGGRGRAVCDDSPAEAAQRPAPLPRPIERDAALAQAHAFLEAAPRHPLALLRIAGPPGMGRTRLLDELRHAAALRGFGVLHLAGDPQLRRRVYGALSRALAEWPVMPHPAAGPRELAQALQRELERRASPALLLALDDPAELDQATLDLLREMLAGQHLAHVALALADAGHPADAYGLAEAARHSARIDLEPLSPTGVHVWLRHTLRWEPPEELVRWFRAATEGIPRRVERGLAYVIDYHLLTPDAGGWRFRYDLLALDLARALEREADGPRHNLPAGLSELVGREAELQQLAALIPQQRLVVLTGPGGIGKTRLALQAAAESLHHFADGVFWVPLAAVTSQDQLADAIAAALGLALSGDAEGGLITALRRKRLLLVMDNVEQLGDDLSPVERLLERAPGVHALLTARTPPALSGAYTMPVAGLPVVAGDDLAAGAVQLLLRRARQADPELVIGEEERAAAGRICRLVEGMPLAIELAAAQARNYTLGQIADALAGSLELLNLGLSGGEAGDGPALPERHRSMAAVLESFWRLLSDEERRVLARLGVFRGGFLGDAARSVAGASPFFLSALVASGYLRRAPGGRYELHELLRQYAAERLAQDPAEHDAAY
ncbi:MAG TPA: diguanylate cyclase, partial [Roseiflexaceae bacterium]|nr:diguanylate cyclase [Roseiflexaceae bacterium]